MLGVQRGYQQISVSLRANILVALTPNQKHGHIQQRALVERVRRFDHDGCRGLKPDVGRCGEHGNDCSPGPAVPN